MTEFEAQIPIPMLRSLVRLDASTGRLYWLSRELPLHGWLFTTESAEHSVKRWNARFSGTEAFDTKRGDGYLLGRINRVSIFAHRVVYALHHGKWPEQYIDHIDGNPSNNAPGNLRDVSHRENHQNQRLRKNNTSGVNGVRFNKARGMYEAYIHTSGKKKMSLGHYPDAGSAAKARESASREAGFHFNHGKAKQ